MCNDPTIHTRTIVTCNQRTEFAFEATPNALQLIIGRGGQGDGRGGSSVHLYFYDGLIVVPRLRDVLDIAQQAIEGIAQHPSQSQMVQWSQSRPHPEPRRHRREE
ncbi:hypothetical protein [Actinophytocola sp.]|uniref:hypothetical protein n=1 Tax=Actinophytocola sp. TaxID=1872138 RepID=UPI002D4C9E4B|nr:hypothetical protein [Actinophytocola sp.]HYQ69060.1 hypothetical protein [Actinophytocola sp.]